MIFPMQDQHITFLGCGNMGASLVSGLSADGYPASSLCGVDPDENKRRRLAQSCAIRTVAAIAEGVAGADVLVLAVKPQTVPAVLAEVKQSLQGGRPLLLSIAAGVRSAAIAAALGGVCPVVRAMPNTPALLRAGATGLYAGAEVGAEQRRVATRIMQAVGVTVWLDEEAQLDAVTAVSGSGPAYFFLIVELLERIAGEMGLTPELASSHFLVQRMGFGRASEMCLSGRLYSGREAFEAGLADRLTAPDALMETALEVASAMAGNPGPQLRWIKQLLTENGAEADIAAVQRREIEALERAYASPEHKEAVSAFLEKRSPKFG